MSARRFLRLRVQPIAMAVRIDFIPAVLEAINYLVFK